MLARAKAGLRKDSLPSLHMCFCFFFHSIHFLGTVELWTSVFYWLLARDHAQFLVCSQHDVLFHQNKVEIKQRELEKRRMRMRRESRKQRSERKRKSMQDKVTVFYNLILEIMFYHFCHMVLSEASHWTQLTLGEGTILGHKSPEFGIIGSHFRRMPNALLSSTKHLTVPQTWQGYSHLRVLQLLLFCRNTLSSDYDYFAPLHRSCVCSTFLISERHA